MAKELNAFQKFALTVLKTDQIKILTDWSAKFNTDGTPVVPATPAAVAPPVLLEKVVKTVDGKTLSIAGEPAAGIAVMDTTTGTPIVLSDGDYTLEDGSTMSVVSGLITVYTPATIVPPADLAQMQAQFAAHKVDFEKSFTAKFAAQEKEVIALKKANTELAAEVKDLNIISKIVAEFMHQATVTPVEEKQKSEQIDFSKMTPLEKYRYDKQNS